MLTAETPTAVVEVSETETGILKGSVVVLSGVFPDIGGGSGLRLGKDAMKEMITKNGGRVAGCFSGKTTLLVIGEEPGIAKTQQAASRNVHVVNFPGFLRLLAGAPIDSIDAPQISDFSDGYEGGGRKLTTGEDEIAALKESISLSGKKRSVRE